MMQNPGRFCFLLTRDAVTLPRLRSQHFRNHRRWLRTVSVTPSKVAGAMHESKVAGLVAATPRPRNDVIERRLELSCRAGVQFAITRETMAAECAASPLPL